MPHQPHQVSYPSSPAEELSDESLLEALANGAAWAMEPLYYRYQGILYALAYRLVRDHHVAEDLVQEAFFNLWRHASSYDQQRGPVRSWLLAILYNRTIDYLRCDCRPLSCKKITSGQMERETCSTAPDLWEEVWQLLQETTLHEALMQVPREQRLVIELAFFEGWTHEEIAQQYQLPLGTVKGRIRLGLVHLKRKLA